METMSNIVSSLSELHALFINGHRVKWDILFLRLWHIHCKTDAIVQLIPLSILQGMCDAEQINNDRHGHDPDSDVTCVEQLLTRCARYSETSFNRFEDNLIVMCMQRGECTYDLKIIDLRPDSPGRTGLMEYMVIKELRN
jgi:hypothetical protein